MKLYPDDKKEWLRFEFCVAETFVTVITFRLFWLNQHYMEFDSETFAKVVGLIYLVAWIYLGVTTFRIRRFYPNLATIGWWTFGLSPLIATFLPART
jgi:hypothetical protein